MTATSPHDRFGPAPLRPGPAALGDANRPLRILQVSPRFAPFVGGTEIHTGQVSRELARQGHRVTVLTTDLRGQLPASETIDGFEVVRIRAYPPRFDLYLTPGLDRVIGRETWDLVHVQGYHTAVAPLALRAAQRRGIPTALTFHSGGHSSRIRNWSRPVHARLLAPLLRRCDLLIGVSSFEVDLFAARLGIAPERIQLIPNGVSTSRPDLAPAVADGEPSPGDRDLSDDGRGPHLLSIGRLQRYKGHQRVIRALPGLARTHPGIRLTILGSGPYRPRLERLAERLGVANRVTIDHVGADERHRMDEIMASATVALFLSEYESQGMAAHEAILAGLPTIVVDDTALGDLAARGLARAVPPRATDAEVAAIVRRTLASDHRRSPGQLDAAERAELERLRCSWSTIGLRLEAAYRDIVGDRAATGADTGTGA